MTALLLLLTAAMLACDDGDNVIRSPTQDEPLQDEAIRDPVPPADISPDLKEQSPLLFRDVETGSVWNLVGEAVSGELSGAQLEPLPAYSAYWFAWFSFWPNTDIWAALAGNGDIGSDAFAGISDREYVGDVPKDAIPPLDDPYDGLGFANFVSVREAALSDEEIVIGVSVGSDARAYPVRIMNWHEIVNHAVGGEKLSVTYCPLTASGVNFAADDIAFGNTGGLYISNMVMYDRETQSFWGQMRAGSILGTRTGERLELRPVYQGTWKAWRTLYPRTQVLSTDTGYSRDYVSDFYIDQGYTESEIVWFNRGVTIDDRYHPKEMVLGLLGEATTKAYAYADLREPKVVNDSFEGREIVVVYSDDARAALAFSRVRRRANPLLR